MNCLYCGHELNIKEAPKGMVNALGYVDAFPTLQIDLPCRSCGATYHIEQQVSGLPNISEEMIEKIRKQKRYGGSESTAT